MNSSDDPYEILGVKPGAADVDIRKAYRKLAMQYHPDKQHTEQEKERATDAFARISAAYEVVSDPSKRHDWDMLKQQGGSVRHNLGGRRRPSKTTTPPRSRSTTSPPPPSSPGLFRSRPRPKIRTGSPSKPRDDHSPHRRSGSFTTPQSPGALRLGAPQSPGALRARSMVATKSPVSGSFANRVRQNDTAPPSPGSIRPQGRPRPRPVAAGGGRGPPRKHNSTGTLRGRTNSVGSLSPGPRTRRRGSLTNKATPGPDGDPRPRRQLSAGTLRRKFRDPFLIFEEVMEAEFGKGYKSKAASGWNGDVGGEKKLSAKKEFKKLDLNGDEVLSKDELRSFIESNEELWAVLGAKLNLKRETCIRIATEVAFSLAKGEETPKKQKGAAAEANSYELSETEFKAFYKNYVLSQKGSYDFFLRTIFAFYDINGDGALQRDEFENFLDLFYKSKETYRQKMENMPSKQKLLRIAEARLDKNKDGELSFEEVRDLLQVAVVITE
mmetsp:Transcript_12268/g.29217  ORF Transcript_12268/g.29217 Transcript_12268/m.29217 type:complete len:496 (+) Transcript_12268:322-1809(+)|eukprot:CAMPEP_0113623358 /NCGR_PEP_ID=MMETSP0017_2-20120614/12011_1 /TAXON_ID=2856 /ORGANISM="Cylindrotheca closterium" /LENGTH=495 /DNA_ID=CAMNT_0000533295 /DNA_START=286 /DNA_END=1773 /DNA_ORIENTATION=- /assembly_acc=CAM_ASM_000147